MSVGVGHGGPSPFRVVTGWFVGDWGSILLLEYMVEFSSDGGHLFLQFADTVCASSL
jgi:hypothetical protein